MKIGIFGGAFNPVHNGHMRVAWGVRRKLNLDKIVFLPAGRTRHRKIEGSTPKQRYEMVCLAVEDIDWLEVSDVEIKQSTRTGKPVATVDSLIRIKRNCGKNDKLFFIIGSDEAAAIESWKDPHRLLELCSFIVVERPGFDLYGLKKKYRQKMRVLDIDALSISASNIKTRIKIKASFKHLVPEPVARYIKEKGLYNAPSKAGNKKQGTAD